MPDTHMEGRQGAMAPHRLQTYVDDMLASNKTRREIVDELAQLGVDRETATNMITNTLDAQWNYEGGGGPVLRRIGPRHMILGLLVMALGGAATAGSIYAAVELDARVYYVF